MEFLKKNKLIVIAVVVVVVVLGIGGFMFLQSKSAGNSDIPIEEGLGEVTKLQPSDIGLVLTPKNDGKVINFKVTKLDGISSIEYDVSYDAEVVDEGETLTVPRGVAGSPLEVKSGDTELSRDLDLGTCSRNVCKYDTVVGDVTFTIRVNFKNGTVGGIETKVKL